MRNKLNRSILNNLNINKNEINNIIFKWFLNLILLQKNKTIFTNNVNNNKFQAIDAISIQAFLNNSLKMKSKDSKAPLHQRKFRRICLVTGRTRGIFRFCSLSRIQLKRAAKFRLITGLRMSSW